MSRNLWQAIAGTVVLATLMMPSARAQDDSPRFLSTQPVSSVQTPPIPLQATVPAPAVVSGSQPGYVHLGAPLYPSPKPTVPIWAGATFIPTPALAPHEMLYPHTYRAIYPPYYHRVTGKYFMTPFGMKTHENWELQGTMVEVKYRSNYSKKYPFIPPRISTNGGPWY
jgi:hypothetical protein